MVNSKPVLTALDDHKGNGIGCTHKYNVTTDSKHYLTVAQNILDRHFEPTAPNAVWVADITCIPIQVYYP